MPWYLSHPGEVERLRLPIGDYLGIVEENLASYEQTRSPLKAGEPVEVDGTMEYAPQVIHSIVTGVQRSTGPTSTWPSWR